VPPASRAQIMRLPPPRAKLRCELLCTPPRELPCAPLGTAHSMADFLKDLSLRGSTRRCHELRRDSR
jgi:hypothetical protein